MSKPMFRDEGCAFEQLISFHGGLGGPQTRAFILHPERLALLGEPIVGVAAVHAPLSGWRRLLKGGDEPPVGAQATAATTSRPAGWSRTASATRSV
jgi:hypothetical protein